MQRLTLKGERGADLVAGLVELGRVEGETETKGGTWVELGAVGKSSNTTVVDLGLRDGLVPHRHGDDGMMSRTLAKDTGSSLYLEASSRPLAF
jgi:hypothetical protein